jgi:glycosyltransferase involved in cell wall biosynthesis
MGEGKYLSVVIPVFNEEASLIELYGEITVVLNKIDKDYEVIFVDDGSSDRGPDIMEDLRKRDKNVRIISFCRNFGQHAAVMAGFRAAKGDIVITLDADLQNPPAEIQKLVKKLRCGRRMAAKPPGHPKPKAFVPGHESDNIKIDWRKIE